MADPELRPLPIESDDFTPAVFDAPPAPAPTPAPAPADVGAGPKTVVTASDLADKLGVILGGLFVLYLVISGNYVGELFNCGMQKLFANYAVKHLLGILTLYFFVTLVSPGIDWHPAITAGFSVAMYILFVISNRSEPKVQLAFIGALAIIYILQMMRDGKSKTVDRLLAQGNGGGAAAAAKEVEQLIRAQWGLAIVALMLLALGHMVYIGKKRIEFGAGFNYLRLFGGTKCRFKDPRAIGAYEAFLRFFGIRMNRAPIDRAAAAVAAASVSQYPSPYPSSPMSARRPAPLTPVPFNEADVPPPPELGDGAFDFTSGGEGGGDYDE